MISDFTYNTVEHEIQLEMCEIDTPCTGTCIFVHSYEIFMIWLEKVTFKYKWLLNRGDHMGRFDYVHFYM
jgi:hypothetical protein